MVEMFEPDVPDEGRLPKARVPRDDILRCCLFSSFWVWAAGMRRAENSAKIGPSPKTKLEKERVWGD